MEEARPQEQPPQGGHQQSTDGSGLARSGQQGKLSRCRAELALGCSWREDGHEASEG